MREDREKRRKEEDEARISPRSKKARLARKAEAERRAQERAQAQRAKDDLVSAKQKEAAAILVRHLPRQDLELVRSTLSARHDDGARFDIWGLSISCGVFFSPMEKEIEAALATALRYSERRKSTWHHNPPAPNGPPTNTGARPASSTTLNYP